MKDHPTDVIVALAIIAPNLIFIALVYVRHVRIERAKRRHPAFRAQAARRAAGVRL